VSEGGDRRARKKAATRALVLSTAQGLFAERGFDAVTIADIASTADVAVQTVFNHFSTKEELFFADRAGWVTIPAEAIRGRGEDETPEQALRRSLIEIVGDHIARLAEPGHRAMVATTAATPALRVHERELAETSRLLVHDALVEAWAEQLGREPEEFRRAAGLTSATWISTARAVADEYRQPMPAPAEASGRAREAGQLLERVLQALETTLAGSETLDGRE
jgi:AcrR family transcriptional regulator